jgi:hypothetical protein
LIEAWASMKSFKPKDEADDEPPEGGAGGGRNAERDLHAEKRTNRRRLQPGPAAEAVGGGLSHARNPSRAGPTGPNPAEMPAIRTMRPQNHTKETEIG